LICFFAVENQNTEEKSDLSQPNDQTFFFRKIHPISLFHPVSAIPFLEVLWRNVGADFRWGLIVDGKLYSGERVIVEPDGEKEVILRGA
jgi:hypothetical protein